MKKLQLIKRGLYAVGLLFTLIISKTNAQYTNLVSFADSANGSLPFGNVISDGTFLYGMTSRGGINDFGTVFKIKPDGTGYVKLLDFNDTINGSRPNGSLVTDGTFLYGMTAFGGTNNIGTIFKIMPDGSGYVKLLDFAGASNGRYPEGSLIFDGTFLYGMTNYGGTNNLGTMFKIMPNGTGFVKLLDFDGAANGRYPFGSLILEGAFLYGMTSSGGTSNFGTVFKIMTDGSGYLKLLDFDVTNNGSNPKGDLILDAGILYGMTYFGGANGMGTIFKIQPDGSGYNKLFDFAGTASGMRPFGSLYSDGTYLYGMTSYGGTNDLGTVFRFQHSFIGIQENEITQNVSVYPNPTTEKINIVCEAHQENATLEILNMVGQVVLNVKSINLQKGENYQIDISSLPNGAYILQLNEFKTTVVKN